MALVTSGVFHLGVDAFEQLVASSDRTDGTDATSATGTGTDTDAEPCEGCDDDDDDCSPVCHDCVCSIGARQVASSTPAVLFRGSPPLALCALPSGPPVRVTAPPRAPALAGVFHPPKA